jgi:hypothetical protein
MGAMDTTPKPPYRTQVANKVRSRRSQETAATKLTDAGWVCFPPEKVPALREVIAQYDELTGWQA